MQSRGWRIVLQRAKTSIGEIDLIFEKHDRVALIEVKKLSDPWRSFERISDSQTRKLHSNLILFSQAFRKYEIYAAICWVDADWKISFSLIN